MALLQQVHGQFVAGAFVIHADAGRQATRPAAGGHQHKGHMAGLNGGDQIRIVGKRRGQYDADARLVGDRLQYPDIPARRIRQNEMRLKLEAMPRAAPAATIGSP